MINIGYENSQGKFPVNLLIITENNTDGIPIEYSTHGKLTSKTDIFDIFEDYEAWKRNCFPKPIIGCKQYALNLKYHLDELLNTEDFKPIQDAMRSQLDKRDNIRIIIQTEDYRLQRLPWNIWEFFDGYPNAEVALGLRKYRKVAPSLTFRNEIRILSILGNTEGINLKRDQESLNNLSAQITWLPQKNCSTINDHLSDESGWDILYFAGHSETNGSEGRIAINDTEYLTIEDIKSALEYAINKGLQTAIFNSCDGLGLARELAQLNIPQIIVMREPIFDTVAHTFLVHFLEEYHSGKPLYLSVRRAREKLRELEGSFLYSSWLPVIFQNASERPLTWKHLANRIKYPHAQIYVERPPCEENLYHEILKPGALVRISSPKEFGKTQLVNRIINQLRQNYSYRYAFIDFRSWDSSLFSDPNTFLQQLCRSLSDELNPSIDVNQFWYNSRSAPNLKCKKFIKKHIVDDETEPIVLVLAGFEKIFEKYKFYEDFCGMLRSFKQESLRQESNRRYNKIGKIRLVLVHSTNIYGLLDINKSPFENAEFLVRLPDFELLQIIKLFELYSLNWNQQKIEHLAHLLGGHPYLICRGIEEISSKKISYENFIQIAHTLSGPYEAHLRKHLDIIDKNQELKESLIKLIKSSDKLLIQPNLSFKLFGMGLIRLEGDFSIIRSELYRKCFSNYLGVNKGGYDG